MKYFQGLARAVFERERERESKRLRRNFRLKTLFSNKLFFCCVIFFSILLGSFLFVREASAATYYVDATNGLDTNNGTSLLTPVKTLSKADALSTTAGDTVKLKRGEIWRETIILSYGGSAGSPITWTAYGTGEAPKIRAVNIQTGWTQEGNNWYSTRTSGVVAFGAAQLYGVWEDDAPLMNVQALASMGRGTFFYDSGTNRIYVRTYEDDDPSGHVIEVSKRYEPTNIPFQISNKDYIVLDSLWLERGQVAGVSIASTGAALANITIQNLIITNNDSGIRTAGTGGVTVNAKNNTIWGNGYAAISMITGSNNTINVTNSIVGGNLFQFGVNVISGNTVNIDHSILSGALEGRYFLTGGGGTINVTNSLYKNPRFANAGSSRGGIATFNVDDAGYPGYYTSVADIMNDRGLKYTWNITSKLAPTQWTEVNTVLGKNQVIGLHTRNHNQMASATAGTDIVNALYINYTGGTTVTFDYADPVVTLTIDGTPTTINVSTETARTCGAGTYDTTYLGDATHGLIGCIKALSGNYAAGYPSTASKSIYRSGGTYYVSSRVLADQAGVNIKSANCSTTDGCIALDATRYYNQEVFTAGQRDGEYADWDAQTGAIVGYTSTAFSWPFEQWSTAGIARLYTKGLRAAITGDPNNTWLTAKRLSLNQWYPLAQPIAAPYASGEHITLQSTQDGVDEAENVSAVLETYSTIFNLFSHQAGEVSLAALTSFVDTLLGYSINVKDLATIVTDQVNAGGVWDTTNYYLSRKIIPTYDYSLLSTSPAINAGTNVDLTSDHAGNSVPQGSAPDIGAYEFLVPSSPSSLSQNQSDGTSSISTNGVLGSGSTVIFKFNMSSSNSSDSLSPQVEVRPIGTSFINSPNYTGSAVSYSGTGVTGTMTVSNLGSGSYHWQARVSNSAGQGSWSSYGGNAESGTDFSIAFPSASAPTCSDKAPGSAPLLYNALSESKDSIRVYFTDAQDPVDKYVLEYGTTPGVYQFSSTNIGGRGTKTYLVEWLSPGKTYYFRIRAGNGCATGPWSNEISAKTKSLAPLTTEETEETAKLEPGKKEEISKEEGLVEETPEAAIPEKTPLAGALERLSIFLKNTSAGVGNFVGNVFRYTKETIASGYKTLAQGIKKPKEFVSRYGEWVSYSVVSFREIVLDKEPTKISDVKVEKLDSTSAVIYWKTNHLSDSKVNWGETLDYGKTIQLDEKVHEHRIEITDLEPESKYFYEVMSQNKNYVYDANHEFTTPKE